MDNGKNLYTKAVWYLVIATVTIMLINVFSLAKYSSQTDSYMNIEIAKPIIILDSLDSEIIDLDSREQDIPFSIKNFDGDECSDISMNYQIKFVVTNDIPVECTLYKIENEDRVECSLNSNNESEYFYIPHSTETIAYYVISIKMDNVDYQGQNAQMKIEIEANQAI